MLGALVAPTRLTAQTGKRSANYQAVPKPSANWVRKTLQLSLFF